MKRNEKKRHGQQKQAKMQQAIQIIYFIRAYEIKLEKKMDFIKKENKKNRVMFEH